jgi:hypothetical protein
LSGKNRSLWYRRDIHPRSHTKLKIWTAGNKLITILSYTQPSIYCMGYRLKNTSWIFSPFFLGRIYSRKLICAKTVP